MQPLCSKNRLCPICGDDRSFLLHNQRFDLPHDHPLAGGYNVVQCEKCGFFYADAAVNQSDYDRYYARLSKYEDYVTSTGGGGNAFDRERLQTTARQLAEVLDDPSARILDVGCANGGLLSALQDLGYYNISGLDLSERCVQNTKALNIEAHVGSLFQAFPHGDFDCVVLSHTLEHVQDVRGAITWIGDRLLASGRRLVYIETPDAYRYCDYLYSPFQDFNTEHINHFSDTSLINLMESAGYSTLLIGHKDFAINTSMRFPAVYGFWTHTGTQSPTLLRDVHLTERMKSYCTKSRMQLNAINQNLTLALAKHPRVIIWGTGQLVLKLLVETCLGSANVIAYVDSNPVNQGRKLRGVPIVAPSAIANLTEPIIITTTLHQDSVSLQVRTMGLNNELIYLT